MLSVFTVDLSKDTVVACSIVQIGDFHDFFELRYHFII